MKVLVNKQHTETSIRVVIMASDGKTPYTGIAPHSVSLNCETTGEQTH